MNNSEKILDLLFSTRYSVEYAIYEIDQLGPSDRKELLTGTWSKDSSSNKDSLLGLAIDHYKSDSVPSESKRQLLSQIFLLYVDYMGDDPQLIYDTLSFESDGKVSQLSRVIDNCTNITVNMLGDNETFAGKFVQLASVLDTQQWLQLFKPNDNTNLIKAVLLSSNKEAIEHLLGFMGSNQSDQGFLSEIWLPDLMYDFIIFQQDPSIINDVYDRIVSILKPDLGARVWFNQEFPAFLALLTNHGLDHQMLLKVVQQVKEIKESLEKTAEDNEETLSSIQEQIFESVQTCLESEVGMDLAVKIMELDDSLMTDDDTEHKMILTDILLQRWTPVYMSTLLSNETNLSILKDALKSITTIFGSDFALLMLENGQDSLLSITIDKAINEPATTLTEIRKTCLLYFEQDPDFIYDALANKSSLARMIESCSNIKEDSEGDTLLYKFIDKVSQIHDPKTNQLDYKKWLKLFKPSDSTSLIQMIFVSSNRQVIGLLLDLMESGLADSAERNRFLEEIWLPDLMYQFLLNQPDDNIVNEVLIRTNKIFSNELDRQIWFDNENATLQAGFVTSLRSIRDSQILEKIIQRAANVLSLEKALLQERGVEPTEEENARFNAMQHQICFALRQVLRHEQNDIIVLSESKISLVKALIDLIDFSCDGEKPMIDLTRALYSVMYKQSNEEIRYRLLKKVRALSLLDKSQLMQLSDPRDYRYLEDGTIFDIDADWLAGIHRMMNGHSTLYTDFMGAKGVDFVFEDDNTQALNHLCEIYFAETFAYNRDEPLDESFNDRRHLWKEGIGLALGIALVVLSIVFPLALPFLLPIGLILTIGIVFRGMRRISRNNVMLMSWQYFISRIFPPKPDLIAVEVADPNLAATNNLVEVSAQIDRDNYQHLIKIKTRVIKNASNNEEIIEDTSLAAYAICKYINEGNITRAINIIGLIDPEDLDSVLDSKSHKWDHSPRKMAEVIPELYHFLYSRSVNNDEFDKKRQKFLLERSSASMIQSSWRDHRTKRRSASLIQSFYRDYNNRPKQKSEATEADTNKPPQSPQ